ncbi:flagellar basal body rod protein FlgG [Brevibacillus fulvus]|uniref:Flagellar hook protein FlgE n=1 Tax=Brevibacillus fulvus TaxID=1125967 RepID=A0A938XZI7_9BACL|nr:flagellar basal body rod protein FlgG [Brevibacillus fulvus]MBM7590621.1 flagellar hook protein FlgE [Brevibacillus fulvus]
MLRSLYSGVSGLQGFQTKLDVIGNNIANVNTVGFKKSRVVFQDILSQNIAGATAPADDGLGGINPKQIGLGSKAASIETIFTTGSPQTTNVPTDLSIEGDGFFMVQNAAGAIYYTRAGNFTLDAAGNLVTSQGMKVLDSGGAPINLPPDEVVSYSIGQDGSINTVDDTGAVTEGYAQLGVMTFTNPAGLNKIGGSLYEYTVNAGAANDDPLTPVTPTDANVKIISGQLEMSNVDLSEELTEMIVAQRGLQANSRIITTSDSVLEELVNLKR